MKKFFTSFRIYKVYISIMAVFFTAFAILQAVNGRFWLHDFQVYYDAAVSFFSGGTVYGIPYGLSSGYFKYSPMALYLFFPLTFIPYDIAKVIYFMVLSILIISGVIVADRIAREKIILAGYFPPRLIILLLITIAFMQHIYYELHLGNINILLLIFSLSALNHLLKKEEKAAGLLLAFAILIKPHFIILLPLMLLRKHIVAVATCMAGIVSGLLIPLLSVGFNANIELLKQWKDTMLSHNRSPVSGQDTIYSWVYRLTGSTIPEYRLQVFVITVLIVMALLIMAYYIFNKRRERENPGEPALETKNRVIEYLLLVALIPNLTVTDSEHFLFSVPLLALILNYLFIRKPGYIYATIIIFILFLYGGNLRELVGEKLSQWMTATGILGLGNILLVGFSIFLMIKEPVHPETKSIN